MKQLILILTLSLSALFFSCDNTNNKKKVYKTTDKEGYCYQDNGIWYIYYLNSYGRYDFYGTSSTYYTYDYSSTSNWTPSSENVSNFNEMPVDAQQSVESMSESSGESVGGSDASNSSDGNGMGESSGESSGGSDSGGDSGGGDGGGGDGGGGGE